MVDNDMLEAMKLLLAPINARLDSLEQRLDDGINGVKIILDEQISREIKLLAEGHQTILDKLPDTEELETMEARLSAVEMVVRKHSKDIQNLKKAQ